MNVREMTHEELKVSHREFVIECEQHKELISKYERYFILTKVGCDTPQEESELNALTIELSHTLVKE